MAPSLRCGSDSHFGPDDVAVMPDLLDVFIITQRIDQRLSANSAQVDHVRELLKSSEAAGLQKADSDVIELQLKAAFEEGKR